MGLISHPDTHEGPSIAPEKLLRALLETREFLAPGPLDWEPAVFSPAGWSGQSAGGLIICGTGFGEQSHVHRCILPVC